MRLVFPGGSLLCSQVGREAGFHLDIGLTATPVDSPRIVAGILSVVRRVSVEGGRMEGGGFGAGVVVERR